MKIILAQGNPGAQYASTRHNVGFMVVDAAVAHYGAVFSQKPKFHADIAEVTLEGEKIIFVKPLTFYNETGQTARALTDFYKLAQSHDLLVIHDDLALPFGTIRTRGKGSDGGNNGIKSLNAHIGSDYHRIRIGIDNDTRHRIDDADFVLGHFIQGEMETIKATIIPKAVELIESFCRDDLPSSSHTLTN